MNITEELELLMEKVEPEVRVLFLKTREFVLESFPGAVEQVKLGWGTIWFGHGQKMSEVVVAILPRKNYVNLEFAKGTDLPDPENLLEGTGKRMRHVKVRDVQDLEKSALGDLLGAAIKAGA